MMQQVELPRRQVQHLTGQDGPPRPRVDPQLADRHRRIGAGRPVAAAATLAAVGWLVAAVAATLTGLAAISVIGDGITDPSGEVISEARLARDLATAAPLSSSPATWVAGGGGAPRALGLAGELEVKVECGGGQPAATWKRDDHHSD
ncbi:hypothetical protein [Parafrankia soli]|uniref:hypothetical protein n=1 Tax=Parafrankia soli TaxID=2599596 RepID=UPI001F527BA4|nr:hypothetical protein [Parafrankia soli]